MTEDKDRCYQIQVTKHQAAILRKALEAYARMLSGQFDMVLRDLFADRFCNCSGEFNHENLDRIYTELKAMIFPELAKNASLGVGNKVYPEMSVAWDMMQVIRHRLAWDRLADEGKDKPEFAMVIYDKPMCFSGEQMAKIEEVTK